MTSLTPVVLMALFGFAPTGSPVQVGPDAPHLDTTPSVQLAWNNRAAVGNFRERWGRWYVRWDERNHTPRALMGPGVPVAEVDALVADIARLAGVRISDLEHTRTRTSGEWEGRRYALTWRGAPVEGGWIDAFAQRGRVSFLLASLHRPRLTTDPLPGEVVLPMADDDGGLDYVLASKHREGHDVVFRDRDGAEIHRYTERRSLDLLVPQRTIDDPEIQVPLRQVLVENDSGSQYTGDDGSHGLSGDIDVSLTGPYLTVSSDYDLVEVSGVSDELIEAGDDITRSSATVQHHTHVVRDWLTLRNPAHPWLPDHVPATVDIDDDSCNAYYVDGTINFFEAGGGCVDFGEIADVVYHEYGHGVHIKGLIGGTFAGDVSEGASDYVSATILDDSIVGLGAFGPGTLIRDIGPDRFYPDDVIGQVHNDGRILGSFFWNLRTEWIETYGYDDGVRLTDELFVRAISFGPTLTDLYESVLVADDDDGDLSNGTPHACELQELLAYHGIGAGPLGVVLLDHAGTPDQPSYAPEQRVEWSLFHVTAGCDEFDPDSARLHYVVDPPRGTPIEELELTEVVPVRNGEDYVATIPGQPAGTEIAYYLSWSTTDGKLAVDSHGGQLDGLLRYWAGDTAEVWCDDFEDGVGDWDWGAGVLDGTVPDVTWFPEWGVQAPTEDHGFGPPEAYSGSAVLSMQAWDAFYAPDNAQYARSPAIDVQDSVPSLFFLRYQRWLTVEKSEFDHADILVLSDDNWDGNSEFIGLKDRLWSNPYEEHVLDDAWTEHQLDLRQAQGFPSKLQVAWTLATDGGLEYSGWALDDVCLVTLADPPGHYRVQDLDAQLVSGDVMLSWTHPWVKPLESVIVVRARNAFPESVKDGVVVEWVTSPVPGETHTVTDTSDARDGKWYYAAFSSDSATRYLDVVEGQNALVFGADAPAKAKLAKGSGGCGCAGPGQLSWAWLVVAAVAGVRRRR